MPSLKRLLVLLVTVCLLAQAFSASAWAASEAAAQAAAAVNNERTGPSTSYLTDQIDPFGKWFRDRTEVIDPKSGNLSLSFTDLVLPGRNGLDLVIKRTYESAQSNLYTPQTRVESDRYTTCYDEPGYWNTRLKQAGYRVWHDPVYEQVWVPPKSVWVPPYIRNGMVMDPGYWDIIPGYYENRLVRAGYWEDVPPVYETVWVPGNRVCYYEYDYYLVNSLSSSTFRDAANGVGLGWAFGFPVLERVGGYTYFHDGNGETLQVDASSASGFKEYPLLDKRFVTDSSFSNGIATSQNAVHYKDGRKIFFASDGRLLGIKDRYGNQIKFEHQSVNGYWRISKITDTLGRVVTLAYTPTQVTLTAPNGGVWRYNLTATTAGKYQLTNVIDPVGRQTGFAYGHQTGRFNFLSKSPSTDNTWSNLTSVTYPGGGQTTYAYTKTSGNLGADGIREYYRLSNRQDLITEGSNTRTVHQAQYTYQGSSDGYPTHRNPQSLPTTYTFGGTVTASDGTVTAHTYTSKGLPQSTTITYPDGRLVVVMNEYDANKLPTRTVTTVTDSSGTSTTEERTSFDQYRNLLSQTDAQGATTTYTYNQSAFHQLTAVTRRQSSGGPEVKSLFTTNPANGNIERKTEVHFENGVDKSIVTDYTYDAYGNLTSSRLQMADGSVQVKQFGYDAAYQNAYLTSQWESYQAANGTTATATTSYTYDPATGKQTSITDPTGAVTSTAYDAVGRVTRITFPSVGGVAPQRSFQFDDANLMSSFTDENGHLTEYRYDQMGRIRTVQRRLDGVARTVLTRTYDNQGNVASETDANGNTTQFSYDGASRLTASTYADGSTQRTLYQDGARRMIAVDPNGNETVTQLDQVGRVVQLSATPDRQGATTYTHSFAYDWLGNKLSETNPNGRSTTFVYDDLNRLVLTTDPLGNQTRVAYDNAGNPVLVTGPLGRTVSNQYDPANRLIKTTDPMSGITRYAYDAKGRQISLTNPLGAETSYTFDALDRLVQVTDALGHSVSFTYDAVGNRLTATDARGKRTTYTHDAWHRLTTATDPLGGVTRYTYDLNGNQLSITDPENRTTTFTYDQSNRLATETNNAGVVVATHAYDPAGNRTSLTDGRGQATHFTYDGLNRLTKTERPGAVITRSEYDGVGNTTATIDPNSNRTEFTYNELNQLTSVKDAAGGVWNYQVDPFGNLTRMTNPKGAATQYAYDALNRMVSMTDALGNRTVHEYDAVGNRLLTHTEGAGSSAVSQVSQYTYDAVGRMTAIQADGNVSIQYAYDPNGNRVSMVDGTGTTTYVYDDLNRLLSKSVPDNKQISYAYNKASQVTSLTDYGGTATSYAYDNVGRLSSATWAGQTATFGYDAGGNRTSLSLPGGVSVSYTYDANNRLTSLVNRNGSGTLSSYTYAYDLAGNRVSETGLGGTTGYQYDVRNQLVKVTAPSGATATYAYDAVGNRTSQSDADGITSYTYDAANRLTQVAAPGRTNSYTWDTAGNQLNDGTLSYSYDGLNRLAGVSGGGTPIAYAYNGDSLLWSRLADGANTRFYLNGDRVINEGDSAGTITASMFQTPSGNLTRNASSAIYMLTGDPNDLTTDAMPQIGSENLARNAGSAAYMLYNGHGDLTGVTDGGGAQIAGYEYDAFGNLASQMGSYTTSFLYTGEYFDSGAALHYLRARFYSPGLGRFLTQDTWRGDPQEPWTQHLYAYVGNNPLNLVDPTGHVPWSVTVLLCPTCVFGAGHIAVLITDKRDAHYFSYATERADASLGTVPGLVTYDRYERGAADPISTIVAQINSDRNNNPNGPVDSYTVGYQFAKVAPGKVQDALDWATGRMNEKPDYNVFTNNCLDFVQDTLEAANLRPPKILDYVPTSPIAAPVPGPLVTPAGGQTPNGWFPILQGYNIFNSKSSTQKYEPI